MAHHSGPDEKQLNVLSELFQRQDRADDIESLMGTLGPTGRYPEGPLTEDDEGEIQIGTAATGGKVVLAFGKPIDWIGFGPDQARTLAQSLLDKAKECDGVEAHVRRVYGEDPAPQEQG